MYPVSPTKYEHSLFEQEWLINDYIMTPDGNKIWDIHHCKDTWLVSEPFISETNNAIDIGCRDGEYTHFLLKKFNHIFCFDYRGRKLFPNNVDLSKVTHFRCALGEETKTVKASGGGSILSSKTPIESRLDLQLHRLDDFNLKNINYIKIDVDGFELRVLQGATNTINTYKPLLVIEQENNDTSAIEFCIKEFNYQVVAWDTKHRNVIMRSQI